MLLKHCLTGEEYYDPTGKWNNVNKPFLQGLGKVCKMNRTVEKKKRAPLSDFDHERHKEYKRDFLQQWVLEEIQCKGLG